MNTLHIVSHTHWDREWYLTFQQFRLKLVHLVDGLLDILANDPDFRNFMLDGQTIVLDDYLWMRPERAADLRRYVQEGRITIGPWHILPDEFLVSPEATIRNLLQGERTARRFGPKMKVGYIPDPFGHIGQMPQILQGFGIECACVQRGLSDEPCEFWWQAPDGSRVFMAYLRDGYGNAAELPGAVEDDAFAEGAARLRDALLPYAAAPHLLLMWGTDHMEPSPKTSAAIAYAQNKLGGDRLIHSTLANYIAAARAALDESRLPVVVGELRSPKRHPLLPNVLSTRMWIKQRNQACETLLEKWAEPFSTWAELVRDLSAAAPAGYLRRPEEILRQAWRLLMENHPHDSICGCSIDQVHTEMGPRFDQVQQVGDKMVEQSLEAIAEMVKTTGTVDSGLQNADLKAYGLIPVVVFNSGGERRSDVVRVGVELPPGTGEFELIDENGRRPAFQTAGVGSRELIHMELGSSEFKRMAGMVSDGRVAGLNLQDFKLSRQNERVSIEVFFSDKNEPNRAAWERGSRILADFVDDPSITTYAVHGWSVALTNLVFVAPDVPGHGYYTLWVRCKAGTGRSAMKLNPLVRSLLPLGARLAQIPLVQRMGMALAPDPTKKPPFRIENEFLAVEAARDGTLTLTDKRSGAVYRGLNRFLDGGDCGDEYNYSPPVADTLTAARLKDVRIERGTVCQTLILALEMRLPQELTSDRQGRSSRMVSMPITSRVTLANGAGRVEIHSQVDNQARDHRLRVHFPAPWAINEAWHDGHFEVLRRPVGAPPAFDEAWIEQPRPEVPQRAFSDICGERLGLAVANRGLPEVEVCRREDGSGEIAMTLLRCVGWLSRDDFSTRKGHAGPPSVATPGAQMAGQWSFEYAIIPHLAEERLAAWQQAYDFEAPLRAVSATLHDGVLPGSASFIEVEPAGFVVSAVKAAETGGGWLVRGYNLEDREVTVRIKPWRPFQQAWRVNLAEESLAQLAAGEDGSVTFTAKGHEIVSVMFRQTD